MPDNSEELQLLPGARKKLEITGEPGQNKLLFFSFIFIGFILAIYGGLVFYTGSLTNQLNAIESQLVVLEKSRDKTGEEVLLNLQAKIQVVKLIVANHISWSDGLKRIQNLINPQVQLTNLNGSVDKGAYNFTAIAPNFSTVAKQIAGFYSDNTVKDLILGRVSSLTAGKLKFDIQVIFDVDRALRRR